MMVISFNKNKIFSFEQVLKYLNNVHLFEDVSHHADQLQCSYLLTHQ